MPGPGSVKVSVYSNGAGSDTPDYTFAIDDVIVDTYITSPDFNEDGLHILRIPFYKAPVYDSSGNLDVLASINGLMVCSV